MNIVYDKNTGRIISAISVDQNPLTFYEYFDKSFKESLSWFKVRKTPYPLNEFYVDLETKKLKKYSQEEIKEKQLYGRILTKEERQLEKLKPHLEEIRKAEQTIEILTLIREVI